MHLDIYVGEHGQVHAKAWRAGYARALERVGAARPNGSPNVLLKSGAKMEVYGADTDAAMAIVRELTQEACASLYAVSDETGLVLYTVATPLIAARPGPADADAALVGSGADLFAILSPAWQAWEKTLK
jgi:hypothetical protein